MRFGVHVSISGGLRNAVVAARKLKCETIQIFSRNPRGWAYKPLDPADVAEFRQGIKDAGVCPVAVHMPYLPNLASSNRALYRKSIASLKVELERAAQIGAQFVVMHLGRFKTQDSARQRMTAGIDQALASAPGQVLLLLENTAERAGESQTGFEGLGAVIAGAKAANRLGVVLDTAHLFESGFDLRTTAGLNQMLRAFDTEVGMKYLHLLHLNDSKTDLGSGVDRHWHIGQGLIGRAGFQLIVNHPLLRQLPGILETPKTTLSQDRRNLRVIRSLVR